MHLEIIQFDTLKCHVKTVHGEKKLSCDVCSKRFPHRGVLNAHRKTHDRALFTSEVCHEIFKESSYFKKHKQVYYARLADYHSGNIVSWLDFFLDAVIEVSSQAIEISGQVTIQREKDLAKIATLNAQVSKLAYSVLQNLYKTPIVSTSILASWTHHTTRQGVFKFIDKMVNIGILSLWKKGEGTRPSLYIHKEYVNIFMQD